MPNGWICTLLGFLAAHFRGLVEQFVLMLADFQASMPFLILALAVLAFFGNSLALLIGLMGLFGWERYAGSTGAIIGESSIRASAKLPVRHMPMAPTPGPPWR